MRKILLLRPSLFQADPTTGGGSHRGSGPYGDQHHRHRALAAAAAAVADVVLAASAAVSQAAHVAVAVTAGRRMIALPLRTRCVPIENKIPDFWFFFTEMSSLKCRLQMPSSYWKISDYMYRLLISNCKLFPLSHIPCISEKLKAFIKCLKSTVMSKTDSFFFNCVHLYVSIIDK
jgi:hypothetical protein